MTSDREPPLHERIRAAGDELVLLERLGAVVTERIRSSLDARAAIDLAVGALMVRHGCEAPVAIARLASTASSRSVTMPEIAAEVLAAIR
ncbi:ANTAR domain-containing protein [Rhodococcus sp. BP-349]|uniref:ANTAR domain-containing protein n=1 Tax=unclassified Rhodococcus (in: high G+C Gram-positive bacteria) TaxID=192944 RepID=UPI001C9A9337|nr:MULTISPECIES: ANTAR domain-containing protein [unclassified Rhodococcus (in: high G+C Gram-positive bacteria)]MBY6537468.1 ANTAR domain-containing protein [Rhodococcus sp. BP-363]MBY6541805.1 ANTAR domain-containing protein [Rhodococcus sp. BP-369]MBY6561035.1 ANTAR domain-containing protein [Rhodococcus sp. BP-370]MBY6575327.1 ANTAR domain-containing protein [Rhodococcus sp. BP-364]MBY6584628.1 ANTAR domain-containing protein [Rhodococcus sp. BP-358]